MAPPYCYDHPRPSVSVDMGVFALEGDAIRVLMIRRKSDPFAGAWALPGGFLDLDEPAEVAARRELKEETGLDRVEHVSPIGFFAGVDRDPRGRVISLAHAGVVRPPLPTVQGGDDAASAAWVDPREIESFAFDHREILATALHWLLFQVQADRVGLALLPEVFGNADIKRLHQAIGATPQAATAWRRRMEKSGEITLSSGAGRRRYRASEPRPSEEAFSSR
jgi:8-oxo-dGTP diphosphatase